MNSLNTKALESLTFFILALAVMLFFPVWTLDYWQAWIFLFTFSVSVLLITLYLMKNDPELLERRIKAGSVAEKETSQKVIQYFAQIAFILVIIFPPIDHRFGWSSVPSYIAIFGDIFVFIGLVIVFFVFKANTFTSAIIDVYSKQKVISTGPYALVRHPMYSGALLLLFGVPLSLGSLWGLLTVIPITIVIVLRLLDEEKFLIKNLTGYKDYKNKVKYRLMPFIW